MNLRDKNGNLRTLAAMTTCVITLSLGACEPKPSTDSIVGKASDPAGQSASMEGEKNQAADVTGTNTAKTKADSDEGLAIKVKAALTSDPSLKVFSLEVGTLRGVVTLYGTVNSPEDRAKAVQIAQNVSGVKEVKSNISIVSGS